jgi:uncharacterized RDD family membrane protein YckC
MDKQKRSTPIEPDLGSLLELQQFIADELGDNTDTIHLQRAFSPLTNGLGLESPPPETIRRESNTRFENHSIIEELVKIPVPERTQNRTQEIFEDAHPAEETIFGRESSRVTPPSLPIASGMKRGLACMLDQLFVVSLFAAILLFTVKARSGFDDIVYKNWSHFLSPLMIRFTVLEFCLVWMGYLAICLGLLERTFGMWVWGLKVQYATVDDDSQFIKKVMRIFWSFLLVAPIVTLPILWFRKNGRNLLDAFSSTTVYQLI